MRSSVDTACSGSSEEITIGACVLDYISELGNIQAKILEAYPYSEPCVQNIESENMAIFQLYSSYEDFVKDCITTKPPHGLSLIHIYDSFPGQ